MMKLGQRFISHVRLANVFIKIDFVPGVSEMVGHTSPTDCMTENY